MPIYLDHSATTPTAHEAREAMLPYLTELYGNASSLHSFGRDAAAALDEADRGDALIVAPRYQGQRGHPVWLARDVWEEAMALKPGAQLRELLRARPGL